MLFLFTSNICTWEKSEVKGSRELNSAEQQQKQIEEVPADEVRIF